MCDVVCTQWKRIARHFAVISQTEQFLQLTGQCVKLLLSRDDLSCSKLNVALALLRWLNHDRCGRGPWAAGLVQCLRLSPQDLACVMTTEEYQQAECETQEALRNQVAAVAASGCGANG